MAAADRLSLASEESQDALRTESLRLSWHWAPCVVFLLYLEGFFHLWGRDWLRVILSILSGVIATILGWYIWRQPKRSEGFAYWILIPWALTLANIWSHVDITPALAVIVSTTVDPRFRTNPPIRTSAAGTINSVESSGRTHKNVGLCRPSL